MFKIEYWNIFEKKVFEFEKEYRCKLLKKIGKKEYELNKIEWIELNNKINKAIERKFNQESRILVSKHISLAR